MSFIRTLEVECQENDAVRRINARNSPTHNKKVSEYVTRAVRVGEFCSGYTPVREWQSTVQVPGNKAHGKQVVGSVKQRRDSRMRFPRTHVSAKCVAVWHSFAGVE